MLESQAEASDLASPIPFKRSNGTSPLRAGAPANANLLINKQQPGLVISFLNSTKSYFHRNNTIISPVSPPANPASEGSWRRVPSVTHIPADGVAGEAPGPQKGPCLPPLQRSPASLRCFLMLGAKNREPAWTISQYGSGARRGVNGTNPLIMGV